VNCETRHSRDILRTGGSKRRGVQEEEDKRSKRKGVEEEEEDEKIKVGRSRRERRGGRLSKGEGVEKEEEVP